MLLAEFLGTKATDESVWRGGSVVYRDAASALGDQANAYKIATVWRAVNVLASAVAVLPLAVFERLKPRGKEIARWHWSYPLVKLRPNRLQTSFRWRHHMMGHAVLGGNYYAQKLMVPRTNEVGQLWPLDPARMRIVNLKGDGSLEYEYTTRSGEPKVLQQDQVFHFRGFSHDGIVGLSVFDLMRQTLTQAHAAQQARTSMLRNELRPSVVIKHPAPLTEVAEEKLAAGFHKAYGGPSRTGRVMVLDEGMDLAPFAISARDAQFAESDLFRVEEFLRYIGVPGVLCGYSDKTATYASAEAFFQSFKDHNVFPWTRNAEEELDVSILGVQDDLFFEFNLDAMLRPDSTARAAFYRALVELGIYTRNEVRELENRNPLEGLDEPLTPLNMDRGVRGTSGTSGARASGVDDRMRRLLAEQRRLVAVARGTAAALVRKEVLAFAGGTGRKGAAERYARDPAGWRRYVESFYSDHATLVAERLYVSEDAALEYCHRQAQAMRSGGVGACDSWEETKVEELLALVLEAAA